jgi:hypothetical protein
MPTSCSSMDLGLGGGEVDMAADGGGLRERDDGGGGVGGGIAQRRWCKNWL